MAVGNRNTLVLNSVCVVRDVVTGTVGLGFDSASGKTAAIPFSMRPPSHRYPQADQELSPRQDHADRCGAAAAAGRAGRPGCSGVFASLGRTWPLATGGTAPTAAWRFGRLTAEHPASVGNLLRRRHLASPAELKPAGGALSKSARGFGF